MQNERFVYANPFFAEMFGYKPEDIVENMTMLDLVAENDKGFVAEKIYKRQRDEARTIHYEFEGIHKSGSVINVEVFGTQMIYKEQPAIIGTIINITERMKAILRLRASEENLRISNERFRLVAKATNDAIWDWDIHSGLIHGNERFSRIYNIAADESINYDQFISCVHPDDVDHVIANFKFALDNKRTYLSEEFRLRLADGTYCNISDSAYILYNEHGDAYRMLGAMRDVTIKKNYERQLVIEKEISDSIINSLRVFFICLIKKGNFTGGIRILRW